MTIGLMVFGATWPVEGVEVGMAHTFTEPINSNDQSLDRVLGAGLPVALVFVNSANALDDTLNRLARDHAGQLLVVKVPAGDNPQSVRRYRVQSLPAIVTVKGGQTVSQAGPASPAEVEQHVAYLLGRGPRPTPPAASQSAPSTAASGGSGHAEPVAVSQATFEEQVLRSTLPVLIDFWAPWCGPCRMVAPTVEKLAGEMSGRLKVAKVNTDENPGLMTRFDIQGIPTMMIFKDAQQVDRWTGALAEGAIRQHLKQKLGL
jgi:thioredoxin 1